ncbi:MAG TPA: response regulator [Roseiflexaceae bacterium]|nr:response regulator [Roseiflexaceae bacterium]
MATLLVVEDEPLVCDIIVRWLALVGHHVIVARDGRQAIERAQAERPDLVLMDLGLPEMSGYDAVRALKGAAETHAIPIVVLTAFASAADRRRSFEAGCDAFETKPIDFPRLRDTIARLLAR